MSSILPRVIALAPTGRAGKAVVVAAGQAGVLGVMDLAGSDPNEARGALTETARWTRQPIGARLEAAGLDAFDRVGLPEQVGILVVLGEVGTDWSALAGRWKRSGRVLLVEVTSREDAARAARAGVDGRIVVGHEAGGACSDESSLILLQGVLADGGPSPWVRGGIGPKAASACIAAGASGVVLDGALLLARESPLDETTRERIARLDGGETVALGPPEGPFARVYAPPGAGVLLRLREAAEAGGEAWQRARTDLVGWKPGQAWPIGQDAAHARDLARRNVSVGGIVREVEAAINDGLELARLTRPMAPGSAMAVAHGTVYPIVQGPMTRVSDTAAFASAVGAGGGLPLLALAMLRGAEVGRLLTDVQGQLGRLPWGVGLLGFIDSGLLSEQIEAVREAGPRYALIAGGRPDQAAELEHAGIATYLHAPSPGLLEQFVRSGARRFVLEGRECGGHVGPRSSLVLWEQAVDALRAAIESGQMSDPSELHVLFAGGIHDARSAAAVSALAAPLAARGVKVGVLVGTAYLFTREAIQTGTIVPRFQEEALRCRRTVLLKTAPGHEVRAAPSPYVDAFEDERRRLLDEGASAETVREALELLNVGRLRLAAKGVDRLDGAGAPLTTVDDFEQRRRGLYMLGQVATLRDRVVSIAELHRAICEGSTALLGTSPVRETPARTGRPRPSDVAIVGMAAIFPGAADLPTFRENALRGVDAIVEVPPDRWDWRPYYDPDPKAPDKIVSKWGGFVPDVPFDPLRYGMPPASLPSIEPAQLLVLEAVRAALDDAGYAERAFPRERTAVVLGMGGGAAQLAMSYAFRSYLPMLESAAPQSGPDARRRAEALLPQWTEDSFPGFLLNVTAGRVANRFDLGGANYTVDAACGSSLAAAALAVRELETGSADMVVLGGADTVQNPFTYLAFSKTQAFSPRGRCRPFDASADGIVISEGVGVVILKRLVDAERDGDRIYAVIKGVGCSSDGRARGLTAPCGDGQARALERAYENAGIDPSTVGYFEAHGTGTPVGDVVEADALAAFLRARGAAVASCAVGSVKSMIGHTKCAAGLAGLIQASLALHHRVLPPTIGVERLNPRADLDGGPLHVNTRLRPWLHAAETPRRAGVSAFGFGGTNFHVVLEAYDHDPSPRPAPLRDWPVELLVWSAGTTADLQREIDGLLCALDEGAKPLLRDLAHTLATQLDPDRGPRPTLALIATSLDDLRTKLSDARKAVAGGKAEWDDPRGAYYVERPAHHGAKLALVFPGQGAQTLEMLGDLAIAFEEVRGGFEAIDAALAAKGSEPVGPRVFPPTTLDDAGRERARLALMATEVAQPAVGAASVGMLRLLWALGVAPDAVAGHSYGELVALHAAGALGSDDLAILSRERGRIMREAAGHQPGSMAALMIGHERAESLVSGLPEVVVANFNGPRQTVIAGPCDAVARAVERARAGGVRAFELPVACAFHSPLMAGAREPLALLAAALIADRPTVPVYSGLDAAPHPIESGAIARRLADALASPVRFDPMIESMHVDGVRVFVECGPGSTLAPLIGSILGDRPHLAVSCNLHGRPGLTALLHALARLIVAGMPIRLERLTAGRAAQTLDLARLPRSEVEPLPPSTWLVNGSRARPFAAPEPQRLGQALAATADRIGSQACNGHATKAELNGTARHGLTIGADRFAREASPSNGSPLPQATEGSRPAHDLLHELDQRGSLDAMRNGHAAPARPPLTRVDSLAAFESFQQTMRMFLDVQQATMLAYFADRSDSSPPGTEEQPALLAVPGEPIGLLPEIPYEPAAIELIDGPTPEPASSEAARPASGAIADRLIEIVRDRTGYPAEMLNLVLDLEADLGIDSIKRSEILGTLRDTIAGLDNANDTALMDRLSRARTLGEIVEGIETSLSGAERGPIAAVSGLRRRVIEPVAASLAQERGGLVPGGVVLVTEDDRGVVDALADRLRIAGHPVERIAPGRITGATPEAIAALVEQLRDDRPLAGLIHALPLRRLGSPGLDPQAWSSRIESDLRSLFLLARASADELSRSARQGGACLIGATAMGGAFGSLGPLPEAFFPGQGGVAGLLKTLAREWREVRVRVVDLSPDDDSARLGEYLATEAFVDDVWPEVGYREGRRVRLRATESPWLATASSFELAQGEPVLVTGGGRGITAAVAVAIARRWRPTLLLVGSAPPPDDVEDPATVGIADVPALKAILLDRLRSAGQRVGPAEVERTYRALTRARQIRETLHRVREAGAMVEYARADVRDYAALERTLSRWRDRHGDPVGVIHGAGVIHDKLLRDKSPRSFDLVVGTKLDGALNLARLLRHEALRFAVLFSSVAGRFGNRGQSDYAAANEVLNKLALWLDRRWPCRVLAANWGPWSGVGMVSDLEGHLGRQGLGMIDPAEGCAALIEELCRGSKGDVEVILASELGNLANPLPVPGPVRVEVGG
jgi:acyl transferase domain-containing protein/NAD(P)H-dependent flavin oxidoreductase YrpB (nitropropane dioxygenase family)